MAGLIPPNSIPMLGGDGPFGTIAMGGMFTVLKVREGLASLADPGWYAGPPDEVAGPADGAQLRRDGVNPNAGEPLPDGRAPAPRAPAPRGPGHAGHGGR